VIDDTEHGLKMCRSGWQVCRRALGAVTWRHALMPTVGQPGSLLIKKSANLPYWGHHDNHAHSATDRRGIDDVQKHRSSCHAHVLRSTWRLTISSSCCTAYLGVLGRHA
jgi:hypothetical protein